MSKKIISWQQYFMGVAKLSAHRSKDPNTQVGACIVSPENKNLWELVTMDYLGDVRMINFLGKQEKGIYMIQNIHMLSMLN